MNPCVAPAVSGRYLSFAEGEDIAIWDAQKIGVREIARRLRRSTSTISRELRRNASTRTWRLEYRASTAQWHAERRARRPKTAKLVTNERLRDYVQDRLAGVIRAPDGTPVLGPDAPWRGRNKPRRQDRRWAQSWSPEQIANRLQTTSPTGVGSSTRRSPSTASSTSTAGPTGPRPTARYVSIIATQHRTGLTLVKV